MKTQTKILPPSLLLFLALLLLTASALRPTAPIVASPNTESSPGNFVIGFSLVNELPAMSYLLVVLPFYTSTITPKSCTLLDSLSLKAISCHNLNTASASSPNPLTINTTVIN